MNNSMSLSHTRWECKYHVVFIPKCRRRTLYAQLRRHLGEVFHNLARQKESRPLAASGQQGERNSEPSPLIKSAEP